MPVISQLLVRREGDSNTSAEDSTFTPTMQKLLITLLVLVLFSVGLTVVLCVLRSRRRAWKTAERNAASRTFDRPSSKASHHRSMTVLSAPFNRHSQAVAVHHEKEILVEDVSLRSPSPGVPEIRITFPDEEGVAGKRQSGRVVVVKISETGGVGLEPYHDEHLPPYQKEPERFQSLDLERLGGLKEKGDLKI